MARGEFPHRTLDPLRPLSRRGSGRRELHSLALGLVALGLVLGVDLIAGRSVALTGSYAVPPLVAAYGGGLLGVAAVALISLATAAASPLFNSSGVDLAQAVRLAIVVAGSAVAMLSAWSARRARASEERLVLLDELREIGGGRLPAEEVLNRTVAALVPVAGDFCMLDLIADGSARRVAAGARGDSRAARVQAWLLEREPSIPEHILRSGESSPEPSLRPQMGEAELREVAHGARELEFLRSLGLRSAIVVPLVARGRALGALSLVTAWSGRRYGEDDLRFAQILAGRVALALDNAGLFSDLESVERRLDAVMRSLSEAVLVYDGGRSVVYANPAAASWLGYEDVSSLIAAGAGEVRERFRVFAEDGSELADPLADLAVPERLGEKRLLRVLGAADRHERWARVSVEPIEAPHGDLLAVVAIEDLTELKRAENSQRLLSETGELLSDPSGGRALQTIADAAASSFCDWCVVGIVQSAGVELAAIAASSPERGELASELLERYPISLREGPAAAVIAGGGPATLELDVETLEEIARDPAQLALMRAAAARSAMIAPITTGAEIIGVLVMANAERSRRFDALDLAVACEIGRRIGQATENARLSGEIAKVAATLQSELLPPSLPEIPGWSLGALYRPAGEVSYVGGDFYDAFEVPGGWMITMGDVVGRGAAAASLTAVARYTLRSSAMATGDPLVALRALDQVLRARPKPGICSAVLLTLSDEPTGAEPCHVGVTVAGHPLPLRLTGDGEAGEVGRFGPLLGAFGEPSWETVTVELDAGGQIVLYTDGVTESKRGPGDRFGEDRLLEALRGAADPNQAIAMVDGALAAFGAQRGDDDVAMLAAGRVPTAATRQGGALTAVGRGESQRASHGG